MFKDFDCYYIVLAKYLLRGYEYSFLQNKYIPPDKNAASEVAKNSSMISAPSDASESTPFIKPTSGTS